MEKIKDYKVKLEHEIDEFIEHYPVNERSVAVLTSMRECWEHVKECAKCSGSGDEELTKEDAMSWMYNMKNEDGSYGAHWDLEQTRPYMEPRGVTCELWKWAAVMNMMYSDYCKAARKNSVDRPEFYADLAAAFWRTRTRRRIRPGVTTTILRQYRNKKSARS